MAVNDVPRSHAHDFRAWQPMVGGGENLGSAGERAEIQLFNPGGSGVVVFVDTLTWWTGASTTPMVGRVNGGLLPSGRVLMFRESRNATGIAAPTAEPWARASAVAPQIGPWMVILPNFALVPAPIPIGVYLGEGDDVRFSTQSAFNIGIEHTWFWWEIPTADFRTFVPSS